MMIKASLGYELLIFHLFARKTSVDLRFENFIFDYYMFY